MERARRQDPDEALPCAEGDLDVTRRGVGAGRLVEWMRGPRRAASIKRPQATCAVVINLRQPAAVVVDAVTKLRVAREAARVAVITVELIGDAVPVGVDERIGITRIRCSAIISTISTKAWTVCWRYRSAMLWSAMLFI